MAQDLRKFIFWMMICMEIFDDLDRNTINNIQGVLELINALVRGFKQGTSPTEAFLSVQFLENVWDWKLFVSPHLLTDLDSLVGITFPHHMRFYIEN